MPHSIIHYIKVALEQGTPEWKEWRRQGIGASDAPTIMGENPYKSRDALLVERRLRIREEVLNTAMALGIKLEPQARLHFYETTGIMMEPACLQNGTHAWLRASVDGLSADGDRVLEIKCGRSAYQRTYQIGRPPHYYYGQLQHVLAVTGLDSIDFLCFLPPCKPIHLTVQRNEEYIQRLLASTRLFGIC
jgi:putative phage-type endonuclease